MTRRSRTIALTLAFAFASTSAFAHARLDKAAPPVGGAVAAPSEIRLTFSEGVEPKFSKISLTGPGGAEVALGAATTEAGNPAMLIAPITTALKPGAYIVRWRAVSVDTHHTKGAFQFTVKP